MKKKIITAIPEVFSLRGNDYSTFVVKGTTTDTMRNNWNGVGQRLNNAITKVGQNAKKKQAA